MKTRTKPKGPLPKPGPGPEDGPSNPAVDVPDTSELMKRMRRVDPDMAKRYRQRSGE